MKKVFPACNAMLFDIYTSYFSLSRIKSTDRAGFGGPGAKVFGLPQPRYSPK